MKTIMLVIIAFLDCLRSFASASIISIRGVFLLSMGSLYTFFLTGRGAGLALPVRISGAGVLIRTD